MDSTLSNIRGSGGSGGVRAFTLLETLVSTAIMALILLCVMGLMNMTSSSYKRTMGKLDSFEAARVAFDVMGRTLRQATLLSYVGYDDPLKPADYRLKSDLHFLTGSQDALGLTGMGLRSSHAVFFQAPLGMVDSVALRSANQLLTATGFFIAYGDDPMRPSMLDGKVKERYRFRLFQFVEPREKMTVYENTITLNDGIPVSNEGFKGGDWFSDPVNGGEYIHPLADNVVALVILPVDGSAPWPDYAWNSRDAASARSYHRLPQALNVLIAVIDEKSALRLGNTATAPVLYPDTLFSQPAEFDADVEALETALSGHSPPIEYRIFKSVIPLADSHVAL